MAFVWGDGGAQLTPEAIAAQRKVAQAMMARGADYSPVQSAWQGAARAAEGLLGGWQAGQADAATRENVSYNKDYIANLPNMLAAPGAPAVATAPAAPSVQSAATPMGTAAIPAGKDEFVSTVMPLAIAASEKTGIDPRIIVAQAAIESGWGKSAPGNNLFGIKSHGAPGGNVLPTTEVVDGQPVRIRDSFAAYASPAESAAGYADFINKNPRYGAVKSAQGLDAQVAALGQSGYATDPSYGAKVGAIARSLPGAPPAVIGPNDPSPLDTAAYPAGPMPAAQAPSPAVQTVAQAMPQGINPKLLAGLADPRLDEGTKKILGAMLQQQMKPNEFGFQSQPDGTILRTDPRTGNVTPVYQGATKPTFGIIGESEDGKKTYGFIDPVKGTATPLQPPKAGDDRPTITLPDGKEVVVPKGVDVKSARTEASKAWADAATGKKTEVQGSAEQFANRLENAEKNFGGVATEGVGVSGATQGIAGSVPVVGGFLQSGNYQKMQQAKQEWVTALLRKESGAAIGKDEFTQYDKQFFPQPGDKPDVIAQKAEARAVAIEAMKKTAGPGYKPPAATAPASRAPTAPPPAAGPSEGATATNPKTGERVIFQRGQWVPIA